MLMQLSAVVLATSSFALADWSGVPTYPAPHDISSDDSIVRAAWKNLSSTLDAAVQQNATANATSGLSGIENVTFSMSLFSLHDSKATDLQYHYTSPQIAESVYGTNIVDADSIYRVASVSKLFTVFAGLLELSDSDWNTPLTDIFPTFKDVGKNAPRWEQVTPWALASHQSGISASGALTDLLFTLVQTAVAQNTSADALQETVDVLAAEFGLPPLPLDALGSCTVLDCNSTTVLLDSLKQAPAVFEPWTTPAYSNLGMIILGQVLLNITGKSFGDFQNLYDEAILKPLNMSSTLTDAPTLNSTDFARAVIAGPLEPNFAFPRRTSSIASGGLLSTINDLNKLGIGILNHTLLPSTATRTWMKPISHTASLTYAVGAPWEIVRYISPMSGKVTDIYTKLGDAGSYSGMLALVPDFDVGFSYLNAYYADPTQNGTTDRASVALGTINALVEAILPALEIQAAKEAVERFGGTYVAEDVNSTLTISSQDGDAALGQSAGLVLTQWISNNTDALRAFPGTPRLLPSIPATEQEVTFHVTTAPQWNSYAAAGLGPFTGFYESNFGWWTFDGPRYGGQGAGTFVFEVDESGAAVAVRNQATGGRMVRD